MTSHRDLRRPALPDRKAVEQFLLWAVRQWGRAYNGDPSATQRLRDGFEAIGLESGFAPLDGAMETMAAAADRPLRLNGPTCPPVTADEHNLLVVLELLQAGDRRAAPVILRDWLPPAGVRLAQPYLERLALVMAEAGYRLPRRPRAPRDNFSHATHPISITEALNSLPASPTLH